MLHKPLEEFVPYYAWLPSCGFVEAPRAPRTGDWDTVIDMVGPHFMIRFTDDYLGPLAALGSDKLGWHIPAYVIAFATRKTFLDYPEVLPTREDVALALRRHLAEVEQLFQSGDLGAMKQDIRRRQRANFDRVSRMVRPE